MLSKTKSKENNFVKYKKMKLSIDNFKVVNSNDSNKFYTLVVKFPKESEQKGRRRRKRTRRKN